MSNEAVDSLIFQPLEDWGPQHAAHIELLLGQGYRKVGARDVSMGLMPDGAGGKQVFLVPPGTPDGSLRMDMFSYQVVGGDKSKGIPTTIVPTVVSLTINDFHRIFEDTGVALPQ